MAERIGLARIPTPMFAALLCAIVVSTVLFVVGTTAERAGEASEATGGHAEVSGEARPVGEGNGEGSESQEAAEAGKPVSTMSVTRPETFLGIQYETPAFVLASVGVWGLLLLGLWFVGYRLLAPTLVFAVVAAVADFIEVTVQISRSNLGLALLAGLIGLLHILVAVLAFRTLTLRRQVLQPER